ncbi:hypothetical protein WA016_02094 [Myxococcus stipitatus]
MVSERGASFSMPGVAAGMTWVLAREGSTAVGERTGGPGTFVAVGARVLTDTPRVARAVSGTTGAGHGTKRDSGTTPGISTRVLARRSTSTEDTFAGAGEEPCCPLAGADSDSVLGAASFARGSDSASGAPGPDAFDSSRTPPVDDVAASAWRMSDSRRPAEAGSSPVGTSLREATPGAPSCPGCFTLAWVPSGVSSSNCCSAPGDPLIRDASASVVGVLGTGTDSSPRVALGAAWVNATTASASFPCAASSAEEWLRSPPGFPSTGEAIAMCRSAADSSPEDDRTTSAALTRGSSFVELAAEASVADWPPLRSSASAGEATSGVLARDSPSADKAPVPVRSALRGEAPTSAPFISRAPPSDNAGAAPRFSLRTSPRGSCASSACGSCDGASTGSTAASVRLTLDAASTGGTALPVPRSLGSAATARS